MDSGPFVGRVARPRTESILDGLDCLAHPRTALDSPHSPRSVQVGLGVDSRPAIRPCVDREEVGCHAWCWVEAPFCASRLLAVGLPGDGGERVGIIILQQRQAENLAREGK